MDDYSSIAPYYEKILGRSLYPLRKNVRTFLLYHQHRHVIDVCCGTGRQLEMLLGKGMKLVGVDSSIKMLQQSQYADSIRFIEQSATTMDLPPQSFDAAILSFSLHEKNSMDRDIILKKSWELVREEGHLIIADYCRPPSSILGYIFAKLCIPLIERAAGKEHYHNYKDWMQRGGLENYIDTLEGRKDIISHHFRGSVMLCSLQKESSDIKTLKAIQMNLQRNCSQGTRSSHNQPGSRMTNTLHQSDRENIRHPASSYKHRG